MERKEVLEKLEKIFREVFDDEEIKLTGELAVENISGWDSFAQINIINSIEEEFDVKIPLSKSFSMKTIDEIITVILDIIK